MDAAIFFVSARYDIDTLTVQRGAELLGKVQPWGDDYLAILGYIRKHRPDLGF